MATQVQYRLVGGDGASWTLYDGDRLTLGRSRHCDVIIADSGVSRQHATLIVARGRCWVRDEESTRGTLVNGQPIVGQQELRRGDRLQIGSSVFGLEHAPQTHIKPRQTSRAASKRKQLIIWSAASIAIIAVVLGIALSGNSRSGRRPVVVAETITAVRAGESVVVSAGGTQVQFEPGSLAQNTDVTVQELGKNDEIVGGIFVDTGNTALEEPVRVSFPVDGNYVPGQIVQLVQQTAPHQPWEPAVYRDGTPVWGILDENGSIVTVVDHFSGYALEDRATTVADEVEDSVWYDTSKARLDNGHDVYVPVEFNEDPMLNGVGLAFFSVDIPASKFPFANKGLNDQALRTQRYKEVLADMFMQTDIKISSRVLEEMDEKLTDSAHLLHVGTELEVTAGLKDVGVVLDTLVKYSLSDRDFLRFGRSDILHWSKYARLDYVARRFGSYANHATRHFHLSMEGVTAGLEKVTAGAVIAKDTIVVSRDIHRVFLYAALRDSLVIERMDHFGKLLNQQTDVDLALIDGYAQARQAVEQRLDNTLQGLVDAVMENWIANVSVVGHMITIAQAKSWTALAHLHPGFAFLSFAEAYKEVIVDSYADMQRATLAATLIQETFDDIQSADLGASDGAALNQTMMKTYLGQYYYHHVASRRRAGLIGGIWRGFIRVWDFLTGDEQAKLERQRLDYLDAKAEEIKDLYTELEAERQRRLYGEDPSSGPGSAKDTSGIGVAGQTSTVLVIDLSGSMDEAGSGGTTKMQAAKQAARQLIFQLGQDNSQLGASHEVAVVGFGNTAHAVATFSSDPASLDDEIQGLSSSGQTNLSGGFDLANDLLRSRANSSLRFLILMTDGQPSVGLESLDEFLAGPVADAESLNVCVMTVAFGSDANEALLRGIAQGSSCGGFYSARNALELRAAYAQAAAEASGENVQVYYGKVDQGETVLACTYDVPYGQSVASFQLMWPGSTLELQLTDPRGRQVPLDGERVQVLSDTPTSRRVLVKEPRAGNWQVEVVGVDVSETDGEPFSVIASTVPSSAPTRSSPNGMGLAAVSLTVVVAALSMYVFTQSQRRRLAVAGAGTVGVQKTPSATLVILRGPWAGQQIPVTGTTFSIGRSRQSSLHLSGRSISRQHAVLRYAQGRWFLQDQGSSVGTFVNGAQVQATELSNGDVLRIGDVEIQLRLD